jgi:hypothetical protein
MIAAGATFRPLGDTIVATIEWAKKRPADYEWHAGMKPEREADLLAKWHAQHKK